MHFMKKKRKETMVVNEQMIVDLIDLFKKNKIEIKVVESNDERRRHLVRYPYAMISEKDSAKSIYLELRAVLEHHGINPDQRIVSTAIALASQCNGSN